ncbi:MAG: BrnT family toxin [Arcobacteraceae bacterium]
MYFEYDKEKSIKNKQKHGIAFEEAKLLWNNNASVVPAKDIDGEMRYALISKLKDKCFVAIFTIRDEKYRIISVRRCRNNEEKIYEKNNN